MRLFSSHVLALIPAEGWAAVYLYWPHPDLSVAMSRLQYTPVLAWAHVDDPYHPIVGMVQEPGRELVPCEGPQFVGYVHRSERLEVLGQRLKAVQAETKQPSHRSEFWLEPRTVVAIWPAPGMSAVYAQFKADYGEHGEDPSASPVITLKPLVCWTLFNQTTPDRQEDVVLHNAPPGRHGLVIQADPDCYPVGTQGPGYLAGYLHESQPLDGLRRKIEAMGKTVAEHSDFMER
jgi:hypothetical protein